MRVSVVRVERADREEGRRAPQTKGQKVTIPKEVRTKRVRQLFDAEHAKPPYAVPTMAEVEAMPWNGLTVATTFAGGGGSSLGYRMAGYRVVWANEFVDLAADTYAANMADGTFLDRRDVREVTTEDVLRDAKLRVGELDLFDGSPPCQAFSTAGLREKGWGTERKYQNGKAQKNEELFWEYIRLRDGLQPKTFVAENVSGLVKGAAKGYFLEILKRLKRGYRVEARVIDAQWCGVPQQRQRVIFVGVREDLELEPAFPAPLPYRYSIRDALPWLGGLRFDTSGHNQAKDKTQDLGAPVRAITVGGESTASAYHFQVTDAVVTKNSNASFPHKNQDTPLDEVSPTVMARRPNLEVGIEFRGGPGDKPRGTKRASVDLPAHSIAAHGYGAGATNQVAIVTGINGSRGARDRGQRDPVDLPSPTVMAGGGRSALGQLIVEETLVQGPEADFKNHGRAIDVEGPAPTVAAGDAGRRTPRQFEVEQRVVYDNGRKGQDAKDVTDRPAPTITAGPDDVADGGGPRNHFKVEVRKVGIGESVPENVAASLDGYAIGEEYDRLNPGQTSDKFFNLVRPDAGKPVPTLTSSGAGGSGSGVPGGVASVCHPTEKRKFTILELKRLCAWPDDAALVGTYAQQWERCGNSVPPVMMRHVAEAIRDRVLLPARARRGSSSKPTRRERGKGRATSRRASGAEPTRA
jgi:DNA-cytosine methyltransferase